MVFGVYKLVMERFQNKYRVESTRLKEWDYSNPWWYYVTINTKEHKEYFGRVENEIMVLNEIGKTADIYWKQIPIHFANVELDYFVVMPNHIHGIVIINTLVETGHAPSLRNKPTLSNIIGSFKSAVAKRVHELGYSNFSWQTRFFDRIIRDERELYNVRKYIEQNPLKWGLEKECSENIFEL